MSHHTYPTGTVMQCLPFGTGTVTVPGSIMYQYQVPNKKNKNLIICYTSYGFWSNCNKNITTLKANTPHTKVE